MAYASDMHILARSPYNDKRLAIILITAMAVLGIIIYLTTLASGTNTITAEGCQQIGGQFSEQNTVCTKNDVRFDVVEKIK